MKQERPFIARFENQSDESNFDVVVHHADCNQAREWTKQYFGMLTVSYLHSDFDHNHTFSVRGKLPKW